ncbi:MAG: hypothetical protein GY903_06815 [Fuerstiella sp.]|nr:hypothetical protein [Fuerstiella sp.]MCP4854187.1 hypothetical protein [Fuerstiella sp.]
MSKFDFKTAFMNHGEKVVAGVFGMLGFLALGSASWETDHRSPDQIKDSVDQAKTAIDQNLWPDEDKVVFAEISNPEVPEYDVVALAKLINTSNIDRSKFVVEQQFNQDIRPLREKRSAVAVLAPEDPRAVAIVFPLAKPPEELDEEYTDGEDSTNPGSAEGDEGEMSEEDTAAEMLAQKFGIRSPSGTSGLGGSEGMLGGIGGLGSGSGGLGGLSGPGGAGGPGGIMSSRMSGGGSYEDDEDGDYEGGSDLEGMYGSEMMTDKKNIRVTAGVATTMIVDLQKQRRVIRDALHLPGNNFQEIQQYIQYIDLIVERRQQQNGPAPWAAEWEKVSSEDLGEILKESLGIDRDIVSPAVTRNTITMPLPRRAAGFWLPEEASHPRVEDFELSAEEKILIDKWNEMATKRIEEEQADQPVVVQQKGFSKYTQSATDLGSMSMNYSSESNYEDDEDSYEDQMDSFEGSMDDGQSLTAEQRSLLDATRATADNRLLLVRFMDFTVERGHVYQYRVRLEMMNPNYDHPLDELEDPALGVEPTLFSGWSVPTPPVFVPLGHHTYLTDVSGRAGEHESVGMTVYTDTTETGLPVMGGIKVLMGLPVSGRERLEVVDLTTNQLESREITLATDELLSAAEEVGRLSTTDHPDLRSLIGAKGTEPIPDQICVLDSNGLLKLRSVGDAGQQRKMDQLEAEFILKQYDDWRVTDTSGAEGFFGGDGDEGGDEESGSYGLGMSSGSSSSGGFYGGSSDGGKRQSSRSKRRDQRSGKAPRPGASGGGSGGSYDDGN